MGLDALLELKLGRPRPLVKSLRVASHLLHIRKPVECGQANHHCKWHLAALNEYQPCRAQAETPEWTGQAESNKLCEDPTGADVIPKKAAQVNPGSSRVAVQGSVGTS